MDERCALVFEASGSRLALAAARGSRVESFSAIPARRATPAVFEEAERLLDTLGIDFSDLDYLAFGCGPGSFTGLRLVAAAVQALAYAHGLPVCRVSSLAVIAAGAGSGMQAICQDAHLGRVYVGLYRMEAKDSIPAALMADSLVDPDDFMFPGEGPLLAVGDGWAAYPQLVERHAGRLAAPASLPLLSARHLLRMADRDFMAGRTVEAVSALPEYLGQSPVARPGTTG